MVPTFKFINDIFRLLIFPSLFLCRFLILNATFRDAVTAIAVLEPCFYFDLTSVLGQKCNVYEISFIELFFEIRFSVSKEPPLNTLISIMLCQLLDDGFICRLLINECSTCFNNQIWVLLLLLLIRIFLGTLGKQHTFEQQCFLLVLFSILRRELIISGHQHLQSINVTKNHVELHRGLHFTSLQL